MTDCSPPPEGDADTVQVTVEPDSDRVRDAVADAAFCRYLRHAHEGAIADGDEWAEFVNAGCGSQMSVSICVLAVEGGTRVGRETTFEWD